MCTFGILIFAYFKNAVFSNLNPPVMTYEKLVNTRQRILGIRSIAFPSISTGAYSFPVVLAAKIAVRTVARFLHENPDSFDLVEWVLFDTQTESVYEAEVTLYYNIRI